MDTKWTNRVRRGLKKIYLIEVFIIILLSIKVIPHFVDDIRPISYDNIRQMIFDSDNFKLKKIKQDSVTLISKLYSDTKCLKKLEDNNFKERFRKQILSNPEYISQKVGFIIINNKTKEVFTTREWVDERIKAGEDGLKIIDDTSKKENVKYYLADNANSFNYVVEYGSKYPIYYDGVRLSNIDKTGLSNYTEIYFSRCDDYDSEINHVKIIIMIIIISTLVDAILIIKWIFYYIKNKKGCFKRAIKNDFLYLKILEFVNCIKRIPIVIKRINIIPMDVVIFISWFIYVYFLYTTHREQELHSVIGIYVDREVVTIILVLYFIIRYVYKVITKYDETEKIIEALNQIKLGDMDLSLNKPKDNQLKALVSGINEIKEGYKNSIEDGIKNEKLKSELISNVSHDLRTPLTSIINYIDILKRTDITEEERLDYINVVENKSNKLKKLIDDLFEISKMNSGKVEINKEEIDIIQLLYQSIGEMTDDNKNLEFNIEAPESIVMEVDGYRMSRVFQNIISNSIKYALDNTRVYIKVEETKTRVILSFKNIANYEMKFRENEVLERFVRGDKSRNSEIEGSGLGLAIARSIIELHDGKIKVEREGDMFKVYIILIKPI